MTEAGLIDEIVNILGPVMGAAMARTSVKVFMNEVKAKQGSFESSDLDQVITRLRPGLNAFVGGEKASLLIDKILKLKNGSVLSA